MSTFQVNNLRLVDNILDNIDPTKKLKLDLSTISTSTTRTLSVPDASSIIVGTDIVQTLTNKTIIGSTNNVESNSLKTTGASVNVSSAAPPVTGQVLQATSATAATWQNVFSISTASVTTTDATVTTLSSLSIVTASNTSYQIQANFLAHETSPVQAVANFYVKATLINNAGVLSITGIDNLYVPVDTAFLGNIVVSGTSILFQVTGSAATTINWIAEVHSMVN